MSIRAMAAAAALIFQGAAVAHHSNTAFDSTKEVVVEGVVTKVSWQNPHSYLTLAVTDANGATVEQEVQAGSASGMSSLGVSKNMLVVGERVKIRGNPNRRGPGLVLWGLEITKQNGAIYALDFLGRRGVIEPTVRAPSIAGRWLPSFMGRAYRTEVQSRLTAAGEASFADLASYRASEASCNPWSAPQMMLIPMLRDIDLGQDVVRLRFDWMGAERVVHLDQAEHPAALEPTIQGHSIGRWDDDTLVIDTVGFLPHRSGVAVGVASGARKHLVERLTLSDDRLHLRYELTIEDPEYLSEPVSFTGVWDHRPELALSGAVCDPSTAGRFLELE